MITIRPAQERGHAQHGWLESYHTFSFADYHDPRHMGFRQLRVINDDRVQPGKGFGTHGHQDMEIITYIIEGALQHKDSMGTGSIIRPGDVQRMSAGTGVTHSEYNPSATEVVHLLQIWILPERRGLTPEYEQRSFTAAERDDKLRLVAARDGRDGAVKVHQDVELYAAFVSPGAQLSHTLRPGRHAWLQIADGDVTLNGTAMHTGDGAAVSDEGRLDIRGTTVAEILLFDLS